MSRHSFGRKSDHELDQLSDEQLIVYLREASEAGEPAAAKRALAILVYGHIRNVERRLRLRMPSWAAPDAAHDALVRAIAAAFDGTSEGEFRSWLNTITDRTAADWFRRRDRRPDETLLPSEHSTSETIWGDEPAAASETGAVELQIVLDEIVSELSPNHRRVVELHVLEGRGAAETANEIDGMTTDNVAQIASRFRKRLRETLEAAEGAA